MGKHLFTNAEGRGGATITLKMHELYALIYARAQYVKGIDPDAFAQNLCCEVEKQQGTYPNVEQKDG